jgi:ubiquinol-cytochrome c reductase cytochrome b subunit
MLPVYAAKAGGFFFIVFGVLALMGGLLSINPVWRFGPYIPSQVTAGSQPDWYMGWPDGALRIMPNIELHLFQGPGGIPGVTWPLNVFLPIIVLPIATFTVVLMLPFIESWITGDKRDHHLLQRPRNAPTRTGLMVALMTFYGVLWEAGGNDILATHLRLSINEITYFNRAAVFIAPVIAFIIARRWCISLQRKDNEVLLHGRETGVIMRDAQGGYTEKHEPLSPGAAYTLTARDRDEIFVPSDDADANGVVAPRARLDRVRGRLSEWWYGNNVQKPTLAELEDASHHSEVEAAHDAPLLGHPADGHQYDGRHDVSGDELSSHRAPQD